MDEKIREQIDKQDLEKSIEELRDVLNEICATAIDVDQLKKRLSVSEEMDKLIVRYMNEINK